MSGSCAGHRVSWFHWLALAEFGNMLIQIMGMCFALALIFHWFVVLAELSLEVHERILFLPAIHEKCFIMQIPKVLVHAYVSCLTLLINTRTYSGVCVIWCCSGAKDNFWVR